MKKVNYSNNFILTLYLLLLIIPLILPNFKEELAIFLNNAILKSILGILLILIAIFLYKRAFPVFVPSLFSLLLYLSAPLILMQTRFLKLDFSGANFLIPILIYVSIVLGYKPFRNRVTWLKLGRLDSKTIFLMIALISVSAVALILWSFILNPDLSVFKEKIPEWKSGLLILGGIGFALSNSLVEEFIFRGVAWDGFRITTPNVTLAIIAQAFIFGVWHYHGFPGGVIGSSLVFIWSIFLGIIRYWTKGMLGPVIAHFFADITIFSILLVI